MRPQSRRLDVFVANCEAGSTLSVSYVLAADTRVAIPIITAIIGVAGGYGGHILADRLSTKREERNRREDRHDKETDEDRELALALAPVVDQFVERYGRGTPYADDGYKTDWRDEEWQRADEYQPALDELLTRIRAAYLGFHNSSIALLVGTIKTVGDYTSKALEERQPSLGPVLVAAALDNFSGALHSHLLGLDLHSSDLQWAVYDGLREGALGDLNDTTPSGVLHRMYDLWKEQD
jgi:hypothetical protein